MRRIIVNTIVIILFYILQTAVFPALKLANVVPNVLIILVVSTAIMRGQKEGLLIGFFSGLMLDILYSPYVGLYAFLYMMFGYFNGIYHRRYYDNDTLIPVLLIGLNDLIYGLVMYLIFGLLKNHLNVLFYLKSVIIPETVYTIAVGLVLYRFLLRINRRVENYEKGSADIV